MKPRTAILLHLLIALAACASPRSDTITQVATIDALLAGVYDGHLTLAELREYGDFGIGTFEGLDGEMILVDGIFYQVRADGRVYLPPLSARTPFAAAIEFSPDFVRGVNVPGFHMHFLADDRSGGGHVLGFRLERGVLEADTVHDALLILLPVKSAGFAAADLSLNRAEELERVEKGGEDR